MVRGIDPQLGSMIQVIVTPGSQTLGETGIVNLSKVAEKPIPRFHLNDTVKFVENLNFFNTY